MLVNFLGLSVFPEESSEDPHSVHPDDLFRETRICSTVPFTKPTVSTLSLGFQELSRSCSAVNNLGFLDDETIFYELSDVLP